MKIVIADDHALFRDSLRSAAVPGRTVTDLLQD